MKLSWDKACEQVEELGFTVEFEKGYDDCSVRLYVNNERGWTLWLIEHENNLLLFRFNAQFLYYGAESAVDDFYIHMIPCIIGYNDDTLLIIKYNNFGHKLQLFLSDLLDFVRMAGSEVQPLQIHRAYKAGRSNPRYHVDCLFWWPMHSGQFANFQIDDYRQYAQECLEECPSEVQTMLQIYME